LTQTTIKIDITTHHHHPETTTTTTTTEAITPTHIHPIERGAVRIVTRIEPTVIVTEIEIVIEKDPTEGVARLVRVATATPRIDEEVA
jgi:hypothetical protein